MPRKTAQQIAVEALMAKLRPGVREAFVGAMQLSKNGLNIKELRAALKAGDLYRAVEVFKLDAGVMYPLRSAIRASYGAGGMSVSKQLPKALAGTFGFNGQHPRAEEWASTIGSQLITNISKDAVTSAQIVISNGLKEGLSTNEIARQLSGKVVNGKRVGGIIGLTEPMTNSTVDAKAKLLSGDPKQMREYRKLKLRDKRYDSVVDKAIKSKKPVPKSMVNEIFRAHQQKAMTYRGDVVARNEVFTAQAAGREEAYKQLLNKPGVDNVTRRWQHNLSQVPREDHVAMSGTVINVGEDFIFSDVRMSHPHDPRGGPKHSVGCRCIAIYRTVVPKDAKTPVQKVKKPKPKPREVMKSWTDLRKEEDAGFKWAQQFQKLSDDTVVVAEDYVYEGFERINAFLRHGAAQVDDVAATQKIVDKLSAGLVHELREDTLLYRGSWNGERLFPSSQRVAGAELVDSAFFSTSISPASAINFAGGHGEQIVLRIVAPKGTKGLAVDSFQKEFTEGEFLLPLKTKLRYTGKSTVKKVDDNNYTVLDMELVPEKSRGVVK